MSEETEALFSKVKILGGMTRHFAYEGRGARNGQTATTQQKVINILSKEDGITQGFLAELLDIKPSSLAEIIKKLENKGLIRRESDDNDKRIKLVYLTAAGRDQVTQSQNLSENFFAGLSESDRATFEGLIDKLIAGWPEEFKNRARGMRDPMARMSEFQDFREQMLGQDWMNMSKGDIRKFKRQFQTEMRRHHRDWNSVRNQAGEFGDFAARGGFDRMMAARFGEHSPWEFGTDESASKSNQAPDNASDDSEWDGF
ncbi:MarR family winged helix-turn-helix transcriptional regulator [Lactococcus insecticola]|uniref:HTH marR-type domain-containing protein n=1 Tax=Pseudolactococcus insecticola TaxID=2709158 RepID=A0A6A0BA07_9LACT|nr:MarR family transcriptional regulator [Lactococcus insecticola]GFH40647.1 hypothetical protein Hs20B_10450 [Lactococcus insecticola]